MNKKNKTPQTGGFPWYPFFQKDYVVATASLSMIEDGAYLRLLNTYYTDEKLPSSRKRLYAICRATTRIERRAVDFIVGKFFTVGGDRLFQKRAEIVLANRSRFYAEQVRKANIRWGKHKGTANRGNSPDSLDPRDAVAYPVGHPVAYAGAMPGDMPEGMPDRCQPQPQGAVKDLAATGAALTAAQNDQTEDERNAELRRDIPMLQAEVKAGIRSPKEARDNIIGRGAPERFALDVFPDEGRQAGGTP